MRIPRVLDASDPRVDRTPKRRTGRTKHDVRAGRDYAIRNPEDALLVRVNDDEGPLTSIDRSRLRAMGHTPWDEKPGYDGQSYAEAHGVTFDHDDFRAAQEEEFAADEAQTDWNREVTDRLRRQHENRPPLNLGPRASQKQQDLIDRLLIELSTIDTAIHEVARDWISAERVGNRLTIDRAREVINRLKDRCGYEEGTWNKRPGFARAPMPAERQAIVPTAVAPDPIDYFEDIPDGYYALREGEHVKFFRVSTWARPWKDEPRPGRKVQSQATDNLFPMSRAAARTVLREIREAKPRDAAMLYANEIGRCCRCGRTLTDDESRARGMGPTCANKGW